MYGISSASKEEISKLVDALFDKASLRFIGNVPKLQQKKIILIGFEQNINLANLFVQAMNNKSLNGLEQDVLKGILQGAQAYMELLKNKTSNNIVQKIDALAREARLAGQKISQEDINQTLDEEIKRSGNDLETIFASESTKARNLGMTMDIAHAAAMSNDKDPLVGFAVIRDKSTCPICIKLSVMPDGVTPRLYRLSELSAGYYKRGDTVPSILGNHPHCRCTPFYVPSDWGFDSRGHLAYISIGHDELAKQRSK